MPLPTWLLSQAFQSLHNLASILHSTFSPWQTCSLNPLGSFLASCPCADVKECVKEKSQLLSWFPKFSVTSTPAPPILLSDFGSQLRTHFSQEGHPLATIALLLAPFTVLIGTVSSSKAELDTPGPCTEPEHIKHPINVHGQNEQLPFLS